jgi:hypothetical protein
MGQKITIASAGNTLAAALAALKQLGYSVSQLPGNPQLFRAENESFSLLAEDPLLLLGLAGIARCRGTNWQPNDSEVAQLLVLTQSHDA